MEKWHFNVLFLVGVGGAVFMLTPFSPNNPIASTGIGLILAFVLTQRDNIVKSDERGKKKEDQPDDPK